MSKSLGNYIAINEAPDDMFGKLMSISDVLMWRYFELLSFRPLAEVAALRSAIDAGRNPRDVKFELAAEIVTRFHSPAAALRAQQTFVARFANKALPTDLPEQVVYDDGSGGVSLSASLVAVGLASSGSEVRRKAAEGAIRIDGEKVADPQKRLPLGASHVLQVGPRRFARIVVKKQ
jgi:tyrosyl-tRNA synthetase